MATEISADSGTAGGPTSDAAFNPADARKIVGAVAIAIVGVIGTTWKEVN